MIYNLVLFVRVSDTVEVVTCIEESVHVIVYVLRIIIKTCI